MKKIAAIIMAVAALCSCKKESAYEYDYAVELNINAGMNVLGIDLVIEEYNVLGDLLAIRGRKDVENRSISKFKRTLQTNRCVVYVVYRYTDANYERYYKDVWCMDGEDYLTVSDGDLTERKPLVRPEWEKL